MSDMPIPESNNRSTIFNIIVEEAKNKKTHTDESAIEKETETANTNILLTSIEDFKAEEESFANIYTKIMGDQSKDGFQDKFDAFIQDKIQSNENLTPDEGLREWKNTLRSEKNNELFQTGKSNKSETSPPPTEVETSPLPTENSPLEVETSPAPTEVSETPEVLSMGDMMELLALVITSMQNLNMSLAKTLETNTLLETNITKVIEGIQHIEPGDVGVDDEGEYGGAKGKDEEEDYVKAADSYNSTIASPGTSKWQSRRGLVEGRGTGIQNTIGSGDGAINTLASIAKYLLDTWGQLASGATRG